jgi:hypothetical protein
LSLKVCLGRRDFAGRATIQNNMGTRLTQSLTQGQANTRRGAGNQRATPLQLKRIKNIHFIINHLRGSITSSGKAIRKPITTT